jgi:hypothetical protein
MEEIAEEDREARCQTKCFSAVIERYRRDGSFVTMYLSRSNFDTRVKQRDEIELQELHEYERLFRQLATVIETFFAKISAAGDASQSTSC